MELTLFNIKVLTGNNLRDVVSKYFNNFAFDYYDQPTKSDPNKIIPGDICITAALNSRIGYRGVHSIMQKHKDIELALNKIPTDAKLREECDEQLFKNVAELFSKTCGPYIRLSTASKILHKKRRHLIPIMDRNIEFHYRQILLKQRKMTAPPEGKAIWIMKTFRKDLIQNQNLLESYIKEDDRLAQYITPLRLLEAMIWQIHNSDHGSRTIRCNACR